MQNVVKMEDNTLGNIPSHQPSTAQPSPNISENAVLNVRLDLDKEEDATQLHIESPAQLTCRTSDEKRSKELLVSEPLEVGLQPRKDSTSDLISNQATLTKGMKTSHSVWNPTLSQNIALVEDTSTVLAPKMEDTTEKVTILKTSKQLEDFPVMKSVVFGDTPAEGKVIELEAVDAATTEAAEATRDAGRKHALRVSKSVGEEYCDFIIGFNSGNYEMAEVVEPRPSLMRKPLRKSVSEGVIMSNKLRPT
jgi:hypothetical protein